MDFGSSLRPGPSDSRVWDLILPLELQAQTTALGLGVPILLILLFRVRDQPLWVMAALALEHRSV